MKAVPYLGSSCWVHFSLPTYLLCIEPDSSALVPNLVRMDNMANYSDTTRPRMAQFAVHAVVGQRFAYTSGLLLSQAYRRVRSIPHGFTRRVCALSRICPWSICALHHVCQLVGISLMTRPQPADEESKGSCSR